jgi:GNAT superfamily N-acetyltransferase
LQSYRVIENCSIRAFEQRDLARLHEIREAAFKPVFQSLRDIVGEKIARFAFSNAEREQAKLLDQICEAKSAHEVFVVEHGSQIVAFCSLTLDQQSKVGEIGLNAVHPDCQGAGIGAWMYGFALDQLRAAGMSVATVGTGGDPSHAPARRAYEKAGFGPALPTLYLYRSL